MEVGHVAGGGGVAGPVADAHQGTGSTYGTGGRYRGGDRAALGAVRERDVTRERNLKDEGSEGKGCDEELMVRQVLDSGPDPGVRGTQGIRPVPAGGAVAALCGDLKTRAEGGYSDRAVGVGAHPGAIGGVGDRVLSSQ